MKKRRMGKRRRRGRRRRRRRRRSRSRLGIRRRRMWGLMRPKKVGGRKEEEKCFYLCSIQTTIIRISLELYDQRGITCSRDSSFHKF